MTSVGVIGAGLIGGSICKSLRRDGISEITVFSPSEKTLTDVREDGFAVVNSISELVQTSDIVFVCVPLDVQMSVFRQIADVVTSTSGSDVIITDVSSVKGVEAKEAVELFRSVRATFVPGHPMAGTEFSGFHASSADMFEGATWVLCPEDASANAIGVLAQSILSMGARISLLDMSTHDAVVASISHLPYIAAASLANVLSLEDSESLALQLAAGSFRDGTRVAASEPWLSASMVNFNRQKVLRLLEHFQDEIDRMKQAIVNENHEAVLNIFKNAREVRRHYDIVKLSTEHQDVEWSEDEVLGKLMSACSDGALIRNLVIHETSWVVGLEGTKLSHD